jgi:alkylation response protein AidB-like acyl-CoA dehydrogenase
MPSFSNVSLGIARGALEAFVELARDKIPRGARKTLRENNVIQSEVAQCEAKLRSARAFIHTTLKEMWEEVAAEAAAHCFRSACERCSKVGFCPGRRV